MSIKDKYKDYFNIGAAVNLKTIRTHKELLLKHFNSVTCENEMKYSSLCSGKKEYRFDAADKIRDFAKYHGMLLRGHTLTWHNQTPDWVFESADKTELLNRLKNHIHVVGEHYKNDVYCWDVVNEAIDDKSELTMRESGWTKIIGNDFMDYAFLYAKDVVPNSKFFYNDYNETNPVKREKIYQVIKDMKDRGLPVDGIGMQCHFSIFHPTMDELKEAIERYASLGVLLHITEMDVSMFHPKDKVHIAKPTTDLYKKQAKIYKQCFQIFRQYKKEIDSVTLWGIADDATWLSNFPVKNRKNWPLLFDDNHMEKEAYYEIMNF